MKAAKRLVVPLDVARQYYEFSWWKAFIFTSITCVLAFPLFFWMGTLKRAEPTDEEFHHARGYVRGSIAGIFGAPLFLALMLYIYYGNGRDVGAFFNLEPYVTEQRNERERVLAEKRAQAEKLEAEERMAAERQAERMEMVKKIAEVRRQTEFQKSAEYRAQRQKELERQQAAIEKKREERRFEDERHLAALAAEREVERLRKEAAEEEQKKLDAVNRAARITTLKEQLVKAKKRLVAAEELRKSSESAEQGINIRIKNLMRTRDTMRASGQSTESITKEIAAWEQKRAEPVENPGVAEVARARDEIQRIEAQLRSLEGGEDELELPPVNPFNVELRPEFNK